MLGNLDRVIAFLYLQHDGGGYVDMELVALFLRMVFRYWNIGNLLLLRVVLSC